uniref:Mov34/MPN/PAD-1 family protein n=1 Tax=Pseudomonas pseudonitroreducens TaxID=2892326 RepID=UPI001F1C9DF2
NKSCVAACLESVRMAVESVSGCSWNECPDQRGITVRMCVESAQQTELERVLDRTARVVDYLGEWHSHPDGVSAQPSKEDESLLNTVHRKMSAEGLPALMVIVAKNDISLSVQ